MLTRSRIPRDSLRTLVFVVLLCIALGKARREVGARLGYALRLLAGEELMCSRLLDAMPQV
jgi:hypothetical protein